jgi:hypothetical protein
MQEHTRLGPVSRASCFLCTRLSREYIFWRWYDIQPMAKYLRPNGKVAVKGLNGQYKLIEASEEFGLRITSQRNLLGS